MKTIDNKSRHLLAKRRVARIKSFYKHLAIFILVNTLIYCIQIVADYNDGAAFSESFSDIEIYHVWPLWGIGLVIHAFSVFGLPYVFGKNWEEKKIQKFMDEESKNGLK